MTSRCWLTPRIPGLALTALALLCGAVTGAAEPAGPDTAAAVPLREFQQWRDAQFQGYLADGSLLIRSRFGAIAQLHRVRQPLGMREQLTFDEAAPQAAFPSPTDPDLVMTTLAGPGGAAQLELRNLATGERHLLTDGLSRHGPPVWSHDGRRVAFFGTARDGSSRDIYVAEPADAAGPRLVIGGERAALDVLDWSLDNQRLLLRRCVAAADCSLIVAELATGRQQVVEPDLKSKFRARIGAALFSRDGRGVYYVSTHGGEFAELRFTDMFTLESRSLAPQTHADVELLDLAPDGQHLAYTLNEAGRSRLVVHDLNAKADLLLPGLEEGARIRSLHFAPESKALAVGAESERHPQDVFVIGLEEKPTLLRWTQSEMGGLSADALVRATPLQYPSWDSVEGEARRIAGWLYAPVTTGSHPVVVRIHDDPRGQWRPGWDPFTQYLVRLGFVVIEPNVRGSGGYGEQFASLDDGALREDSVRDLGALLVWLGLQDSLDRTRVCLEGTGYGALLALLATAQYGDRITCAVAADPLLDLPTFLASASADLQASLRAEYGDERDPNSKLWLRRLSPVSAAALIRRPVLLMDVRGVPIEAQRALIASVGATGGRIETWRDDSRDAVQQASAEPTVAEFLVRQLLSRQP